MKSFSTRTFSGLGLAFALAIVLASGCHSGDGVENALGEGGDGGGDTEEALNGVLKIEQERYSFLEGAGIVTIEVLRAGGAQGAVSVSYAAAGDSAAAFADFIVREGERLVWEDGDAEPKEISILIQGNDDDDGTRQFSIALAEPAGGAALGSPASAVIAIRDDDGPAGSAAAPWAVTAVLSSSCTSGFSDVATDAEGNAYAVGYIQDGSGGACTFDFGGGWVLSGVYGNNPVIAKYDAEGVIQWARTIWQSSVDAESWFNSVAVDSTGNAYVAGDATYYAGGICFGDGGSVCLSMPFLSGKLPIVVKYAADGMALWARTLTSGESDAGFSGIAVDSLGNTYAAGDIYGSAVSYCFDGFLWSPSLCVTGSYAGENAVIVSYDTNGNVRLATTTTYADQASQFHGVSVDADGNAYAVGHAGPGNTIFSNGVGFSSLVPGAGIVKYNSSGLAQWARSIPDATDGSGFMGVAAGASGAVYAVGYLLGASYYDFGYGVGVQPSYAGQNPVIVKYDASTSAPLWAMTASSASAGSWFQDVSVDAAGNPAAVGTIIGTNPVDFGNAVSIAGAHGIYNIALVNYDANGAAQWARTVVSAPDDSQFYGVSVAPEEGIYAVGYVRYGPYDFGDGVTLEESGTMTPIIVKYLLE